MSGRDDAVVADELRRVRTVIEHAPDAIAVHCEGRFVLVNRAMVVTLGYDRSSELLGRSLLDIVHPDDRELALRRMRAIYETGRPNPSEEHRILRRDGTVAVAEVVGVRIDWDGAPAVVTFGRDVTERKRMQAQLLLRDRLAALGTLCAGVAHEINNPLGYAITSLERVSAGLAAHADALRSLAAASGDDATRKAVQAALAQLEEIATSHALVCEGTAQVRRIVADLRTLGRQDGDARGPVDVRWVLDAAVKLARYDIARRAELTLSYGDVPLVDANGARLEQVFLNLLANAAQAFGDGDKAQNHIQVRSTTADGWAVVEISDSGAGFTAEVARRMFDPFFTTKSPGEGVGLGLAICHGIVTELGGRIEVESAPGRGSTFRVLLPPYDSAQSAEPDAPS